MGLFDNLFGKKESSRKPVGFNPEAMLMGQKGFEAYEKQDYRTAISYFDQALAAQPGNQNFYILRGTTYEELSNQTAAERDYKKALELNPNSSTAAFRLAMLYAGKKDLHQAVKWLESSYKNAPKQDVENTVGIAKLFFIRKKVIASNLGNFLTQMEKYKEGFQYLDEAIQLDPNYPNPYMAKGMAYAKMGAPEKGIPLLKKAAQLGHPQARMGLQMLEQLSQEPSAPAEDENELKLEFAFHSSDHIRYANGQRVSGPHGGAPRAVQVQDNINGGKGYTVTIFNIDGGQPSIQMAPKQMELIGMNEQFIKLRGFGKDSMGGDFSDYGLTIVHDEGEIEKCILHLHDRNVNIEYLS